MKKADNILFYFKKEILTVVLIIISGIVYNVGMVFGPIFQGRMLDDLLAGTSVVKSVVLYIAVIVTVQLFRFLKRFYVRRFANKTTVTMRKYAYNTILYRNIDEVQKESTGELMTRLVSDVDMTVEGIRKFTTEIFDTWVLMASYIVTLCIYDLKMTVFSSVFIVLAMSTASFIKKTVYSYTKSFREKASVVSNETYALTSNVALYKRHGRYPYFQKQYENHINEYASAAVKANVLENSMPALYKSIASLGFVVIIYMGIGKVIAGNMTIGDFTAYLTMFTAFTVKASKAGKLFNSVQKAEVSWRRITPYLKEYKELQECRYKPTLATLDISGLRFGYEETPLIDNLSLHAKAGDIIGITGNVACGKTTLAELCVGLHEYTGSIQINGKEVQEMNTAERPHYVSYMAHQPYLFSSSIKDNITLGCSDSIDSVMKDVCFDEDMENMEQGVDTLVGNHGIRLSGGQQARVALARALYTKAPLIVLDDPFSAVDKKSEKQIFHNLKEHYQDSIILIFSHRLMMFDECTKVVVFDEMIKVGTHEEMLSESSLYRSLYEKQCGGETDAK